MTVGSRQILPPKVMEPEIVMVVPSDILIVNYCKSIVEYEPTSESITVAQQAYTKNDN